MNDLAICAADVRDAAWRLAGVAVRTPLLEFPALNERARHRVLVKFEGVQHTGAFKFRGAYNRLSCLSAKERAAGVVAWSGGNHALGVALASRMVGIGATTVMPADSPANKLANTQALGAQVVLYDRHSQSREEIATALAQERGAVLVPSFDGPHVIAGQGTTGLEIIEQAGEMGVPIGRVLVCCSGGGLAAGIATAVKDVAPLVDIYSVEPEAFDDTARSLASGQREVVAPGAQSICDALLSPSPGTLTFPINKALLTGGLIVSDDQVRDAMRFAFSTMKLVVEPGGAVALAAVLCGLAPQGQGATVVVLSGGNVDAHVYADIMKVDA